MQLSHTLTQATGRITAATATLVLLATAIEAQERQGIPVTIDLAGIYTDAFGGTGGGFQVTVSTPLPLSVLGAQYTVGGQFWYSQTRLVGGTIEEGRRQLTGLGGHLTAAWNISNTVFPYLRLPVQGIRSEVNGGATTGQSIPIQNQAGTTSSFAFGIAGGAMVQLGRAFNVYGGFSTLAQRLYQVSHTPIWSLELGIGVAPGAIGRR